MANRFFGSLMTIAFVAVGAVTSPANAQENASTVSGPLPRTMAAPIRIMPVAGATSFSRAGDLKTDNFNNGFSAGVLADIGSRFWTFETGILSLQAHGASSNNGTQDSVNVDNWGVPLLAKLNFSGKPHETVFLKAGALPIHMGGDVDATNVFAVGGIGAALPLGRNTSIQLDAAYNREFTNQGNVTDLQGLSLLGGLAFNM